MKQWIIARASERSTVVGIVTALGNVFGWLALPGHAESIATLSALVASAALVAVKEHG